MKFRTDTEAEGDWACINEDAGIDVAAIAEESRRAGWGASTRHELASDHTACSSMIYRDSCWCWTGTWIMDSADGGGGGRSVEHGQQGFVSSLLLQLFPPTPVEPSQELHHRKKQALDAALPGRHPYPQISARQR